MRLLECARCCLPRILKCGGHIANQAAIELAKEKVAGFFCRVEVGGHIKGMVKSAKEAGLMVAIDGCPVQCAAKILQHMEIKQVIQIVVTKL